MKSIFDNKIKQVVLISLVALLSLIGYVIWSAAVYRVGFPLDDAWIHQTYARNFASAGAWFYLPGQVSGGSTGPLWGIMLSITYLLGVGPIPGAFILGWICLTVNAWLGMEIFQRWVESDGLWMMTAGLFLALEWHLVWAAGSGMETLLFAGLILGVFLYLQLPNRKPVLIGTLIGLAVWSRPGGLTLLGPVTLVLIFQDLTIRERIRNLIEMLAGCGLMLVLYFLFNWGVAGDIWPNTLYAKQAEYQSLTAAPLLDRYWDVSKQFLTGVGSLLVPGVLLFFAKAARNRRWEVAGPIIWAVGYIGLYAWRLPVTYQHGRYIIPAIPVLLISGIAGMHSYLDLGSPELWKRVISRAYAISAVVILVAFWLKGGRAYALDVAVIETEMVETAVWIRENTAPSTVLAAHDIGALGYFAERNVIDLAGLITPDVIPFIRDEQRLAVYLNGKQVDFLVTFPDWYTGLTENLKPVYQSPGTFTGIFGRPGMAVYPWPQK